MSRPRIRTLKPDNWADEAVGSVSRDARLLRDVLITFADDDGRWRQLPAAIIGHGYPYDDDVTAAKVRKWTAELVAVGIVILYQADGGEYGCFPRWHGHQRINRYLPSKLPACPDPRVIQRDGSPTSHAQLTEDSVSAHPLIGIGSKEGKNSTVAASGDVDAVFAYWQERTNRPKAVLSSDRRKMIAARLKTHSVEQLKRAVDGSQSPDAVNEKTGHRYDSLDNIFRNVGNLETNIERAQGRGTTSIADLAARIDAATKADAA